MELKNYIVYHRQSIDNPLFSKPLIWHYWQYCLLKASFQPNKIVWNAKEVVIERGEFITGREVASKETGLSSQNIRTAQRYLINLGMIEKSTSKSTSKYTVLKVCKYNTYQYEVAATNQQTNQQLTSKQPATNQQLTTYNKENKENTVKNKKYMCVFKEFWELYPARNGKKLEKAETITAFNRLKEDDLGLIITCVKNYAKHVSNGIGIKDPKRFLKNDYWKDFIEKAEENNGQKKGKFNITGTDYSRGLEGFDVVGL